MKVSIQSTAGPSAQSDLMKKVSEDVPDEESSSECDSEEFSDALVENCDIQNSQNSILNSNSAINSFSASKSKNAVSRSPSATSVRKGQSSKSKEKKK